METEIKAAPISISIICDKDIYDNSESFYARVCETEWGGCLEHIKGTSLEDTLSKTFEFLRNLPAKDERELDQEATQGAISISYRVESGESVLHRGFCWTELSRQTNQVVNNIANRLMAQ